MVAGLNEIDMCCRYLLFREHLAVVLRELGVPLPPEFVSRYNIAPGGPVPAVRAAARSGGREATRLHWGLAPSWAGAKAVGELSNARAETLASKPAFREAFQFRRCLIPASGFYEWEAHGRTRLPWLFRSASGAPFCLAGLWEPGRGPDGAASASCAVITTAPNELMRPIHHRMPLIVPAEAADRWLDPAAGSADLADLLLPAPAGALSAIRVGQRVNRADRDDKLCLLPASPAEETVQFDLGLN